MAENKTKANALSVSAFIGKIADPAVRKDCSAVIDMMKGISKTGPVMWGSAIIGFGTRHYVYESGREGDTMIVGLSPRKQALTFYLAGGLEPQKAALARLGKYTTGKGCLYIRSLADVDLNVLRKILAASYKSVKA